MKKSKKMKKSIMIKNVRAIDSEAFRVISALYLTSGMNNPHLEFKQVKKGIFKSKQLKNIHLEISNVIFNNIKGCIMHIVDLNNNTKVMSKFLKSCKEITRFDIKNSENNKEKKI